MPGRVHEAPGDTLDEFHLVETPRLRIAAADTHGVKKRAYRLIHQERMERDLGLPAGLSWSRFMKPFHRPPPPRVYLVAERGTGDALGVILLWRPSPGAWPMMHYGFARAFRGRGFGTEAVAAVVKTLLDEDRVPGVGAVIAHSNAASIRVARAAGFRSLHEQQDAALYGVTKDDAVEVWMRAEAAPPGTLDEKVRWAALRLAAQLSMLPYLRKAIRWILEGMT